MDVLIFNLYKKKKKDSEAKWNWDGYSLYGHAVIPTLWIINYFFSPINNLEIKYFSYKTNCVLSQFPPHSFYREHIESRLSLFVSIMATHTCSSESWCHVSVGRTFLVLKVYLFLQVIYDKLKYPS